VTRYGDYAEPPGADAVHPALTGDRGPGRAISTGSGGHILWGDLLPGQHSDRSIRNDGDAGMAPPMIEC